MESVSWLYLTWLEGQFAQTLFSLLVVLTLSHSVLFLFVKVMRYLRVASVQSEQYFVCGAYTVELISVSTINKIPTIFFFYFGLGWPDKLYISMYLFRLYQWLFFVRWCILPSIPWLFLFTSTFALCASECGCVYVFASLSFSLVCNRVATVWDFHCMITISDNITLLRYTGLQSYYYITYNDPRKIENKKVLFFLLLQVTVTVDWAGKQS